MKSRLRYMEDLLFFGGEADRALSSRKRYQALRRSLLVLMLFLTLVPLVVTAGVGFVQYRSLIQEQTSNHLRWQAERAVHSLEVYLESLKQAIVVIANSYTVEELSNQERLDHWVG